LCFDAAELAEPNLGYIVENRALANAALSSFRERGGVLLASNVSALNSSADCVTLHAAGGTHTARLVIGADGARSQVREWLGIEISVHDYQQSAIVATVATARPHQHTAWQRFLASGPLALLPLFDGSCSIVWSADKALADELMQLDSVEFAARLTAASDGVLGGIRLLSERLAVPLQRRVARRLVGPRSALLGDAAHVVHPLAGQGFNLGLLDAAALAEALALAVQEREDPGAVRVLRRYEQARLTHNALMSASMSAFNELFSRGPGPGGWLAARLLGLAGASATTRRWFARRALGLSGELPSLARGGRLARAASW
jgi:2-octaprenylphenol hydroxylase